MKQHTQKVCLEIDNSSVANVLASTLHSLVSSSRRAHQLNLIGNRAGSLQTQTHFWLGERNGSRKYVRLLIQLTRK